MKRLFYLMLVVLGTMAFASCSDDDDNKGGNDGGSNYEGNGTITMVADDERIEFSIGTFKEGDEVTIDWGDGTVETFKSVIDIDEDEDIIWYDVPSEHSYTDGEDEHTIVITGNKNISGLWFSDGSDYRLASLDVSECTELVYLWCCGAQLTSLDVTKNTKLVDLNCWNNQLTTLDVTKCTELTDLTCSRNSLTKLDVSKNTKLTYLSCGENRFADAGMNNIYEALPVVDYGELNCDYELGDPSIAEAKGWYVYSY